MDVQSAENDERRDQQDPARADRPGEEADDERDCGEKKGGGQPAAKATSSLVSSTASFFMSA